MKRLILLIISIHALTFCMAPDAARRGSKRNADVWTERPIQEIIKDTNRAEPKRHKQEDKLLLGTISAIEAREKVIKQKLIDQFIDTIIKGNLETIVAFRNNIQDINQRGSLGMNPLDVANYIGNPVIQGYLISQGAEASMEQYNPMREDDASTPVTSAFSSMQQQAPATISLTERVVQQPQQGFSPAYIEYAVRLEQSAKVASVKLGEDQAKMCKRLYLEDGLACGKIHNSAIERYQQHVVRKKQCPGCSEVFGRMDTLQKHLDACPNDVGGKAKALADKIRATDMPEKCKYCNGIFAFANDISNKHNCSKKPKNREEIPPTIPCDLTRLDGTKCEKMFNTDREKNNHKNEQHVFENLSCPTCKADFSRKINELYLHLKNCGGEAQALYRKVAANEDKMKTKCKVCNVIFSNYPNMTKHKCTGVPRSQVASSAVAAAAGSSSMAQPNGDLLQMYTLEQQAYIRNAATAAAYQMQYAARVAAAHRPGQD